MTTRRSIGSEAAPGRSIAVVVCAAVFLLLSVAAALAADPTDKSFGTDGIAEIEARQASPRDYYEQVGGIVDLERGRDGKLLAAVYGIAKRGHYFAAARIGPDGALDKSFGESGFTQHVGLAHEEGGRGALQAEAVAEAPNGDIVLAGNFENEGAYAPALARFTPDGRLERSFGVGGKVTPRPSYRGKRIGFGEEGGEVLHDVAVEPNGTIVGVGHVIAGRRGFDFHASKEPAAVLFGYRPDGDSPLLVGEAAPFAPPSLGEPLDQRLDPGPVPWESGIAAERAERSERPLEQFAAVDRVRHQAHSGESSIPD